MSIAQTPILETQKGLHLLCVTQEVSFGTGRKVGAGTLDGKEKGPAPTSRWPGGNAAWRHPDRRPNDIRTGEGVREPSLQTRLTGIGVSLA